MSIRSFATKLFNHGSIFVRLCCKRNIHQARGNIEDAIHVAQKGSAAVSPAQAVSKTQIIPKNFVFRNVGSQIGLQARRILIDNVLNRVTNSLAADLRKRAARRILYGDSAPFFAFVGVSLASGTGILTKEEELEGVCWEIREAISKIKWSYDEFEGVPNEPVTLQDLSFGKPIAKGANAVVYAAKLNKKESSNIPSDSSASETEKTVEVSSNLDVISAAPITQQPKITKIHIDDDGNIEKYPLGVKMMFNYDIQSNAVAILKAMYRETVPARLYYSNVGIQDWEMELSNKNLRLPAHPNIVTIYSVFTDFVPELEDCRGLYPAALPARIYPEGEGRNMSLFLLMKRYHTTIQQFVQDGPPSIRTSIFLLAQLLEGVAHLVAHNIAHRDIKADNLLLDLSDPTVPVLVISDFGCCLADKQHGLTLPYSSYEVDKGGNSALMAPEIYLQQPGTFSVLNYTKSDLWAVGAVAYEIFGEINPFYGSANREKLKNCNYTEDQLPALPAEVPEIIRELVKNLLQRNPNKRLHPEIAANVTQLFLWAPSIWLKPGIQKLPSSAEILQWLLSLTTKVLCEGQISGSKNIDYFSESNQKLFKNGRRTYPEYLLISNFLCRAKIANIRSALSWIHNTVFGNY